MNPNNPKHLKRFREALKHSLRHLRDKLARTKSALLRIKGETSKQLRAEIEDFLKAHLGVEKTKAIFDHRRYGERASLEVVLFGDFPVE